MLSMMLRDAALPEIIAKPMFRIGSVWMVFTLYMVLALMVLDIARFFLPQIGNGFVYAPVYEGQFAGSAHILVDGECVGTVELEYGSTIEQLIEQKHSIWKRLIGG